MARRMKGEKERGCGGLENHGKQEHAGKAELTSRTSLRLTERNYIKDIIGEECHLTPPPPHHNIFRSMFVVSSILSIAVHVATRKIERCGTVFSMEERASGGRYLSRLVRKPAHQLPASCSHHFTALMKYKTGTRGVGDGGGGDDDGDDGDDGISGARVGVGSDGEDYGDGESE